MHSVRIDTAKLILVGTKITYQAIGDVGMYSCLYIKHDNVPQDQPMRCPS